MRRVGISSILTKAGLSALQLTSRSLSRDPADANDITRRVSKLEQELSFWSVFRREVERSNPDLVNQAALRATEINLSTISNDLPPGVVFEDKDRASAQSGCEGTRAPTVVSNSLLEELYEFYALQSVDRFVMGKLMAINNEADLIEYANYLNREFLVRLSRKAHALRYAPVGLATMPALRQLRRWYEMSFADMRTVQPCKTRADLIAFDTTIRRILSRHINTSDLLSKGMYQFADREDLMTEKRLNDVNLIDLYKNVQVFFDNFVRTRVKLRLFLGQYLALTERLLSKELGPEVGKADGTLLDLYNHEADSFIGMISSKCDIRKVVLRAVDEAIQNEAEGMEAPEVTIQVFEDGASEPYVYDAKRQQAENDGTIKHAPFTFTCVPSISFFIIASLVSESLHATLTKQRAGGERLPVTVRIVQGRSLTDTTITVQDAAGGMSLPVLRTSLTYFSACRVYMEDLKLPCGSNIKVGRGWNNTPIRLPYAQIAAKVLGSDITVTSLEGIGTERSLHLTTNAKKFKEIKL